MAKTILETTADYVRQKLYNAASGHDWYHVDQVRTMALRIAKKEGGNRDIIEIAALAAVLDDDPGEPPITDYEDGPGA